MKVRVMTANSQAEMTVFRNKRVLLSTGLHLSSMIARVHQFCWLCIFVFFLFGAHVSKATSVDVSVFLAPLDHSTLSNRLLVREVEAALQDLGIAFTDARVTSSNSGQPSVLTGKDRLFHDLSLHLERQDKKGLLIETSISQVENGRVLPALRVTVLPTGRRISSVTSLDLPAAPSSDELRIAAISLARRALRQMRDNSQDLDWTKGLSWASDAHRVVLAIENFNACQQNYILEEIETEFPGFISIDLVETPQSHYAKFNYMTTAKLQRLIKWLNIFFIEHQLVPRQDFTVLYSNQKLRLIKEQGAKIGEVCSLS